VTIASMSDLRKAEMAGLSKEEKTLESVRKVNFRDLEALSVEQLLFAFLRSEEVYTDIALKALVDFTKRLRVKKISAVDETAILGMFLNIEAIYDFNCQFLADLKNLTAEGRLLSDLGKTVVSMGPFFKLYGIYVNAQQQASDLYRKLANDSSKFNKMLLENHAATGFKMSTLMEVPTLRLPQYLIYLGALAIKLQSHSEYSGYMPDIQQAIAQLKNTLDSIANNLRDKNAREAVVQLQVGVFKNNVELVDPGRYLIKKGKMILVAQEKSLFKANKEKILVALFNDMFMIVNPGGSIKKILRLRSLKCDELADNSVQKIKNGFRLSDGHNFYNLECPSASSRNNWIENVQEAVEAQSGSLLGSNIDDDYFEKMILKKVPLVALVDSKQLARDVSAKNASSTDPNVTGMQFDQKADYYEEQPAAPIPSRGAPPPPPPPGISSAPPPAPAPGRASRQPGYGGGVTFADDSNDDPYAPVPTRSARAAPAPGPPPSVGRTPSMRRAAPPPPPGPDLQSIVTPPPGPHSRGGGRAAPPPPPPAPSASDEEQYSAPVVPTRSARNPGPPPSVGSVKRAPAPPPPGPELQSMFNPPAVSNPPPPSRGSRGLPPAPPKTVDHNASFASTISSQSALPPPPTRGRAPAPAPPAAGAPPPPG
jgi:hypothetical protein